MITHRVPKMSLLFGGILIASTLVLTNSGRAELGAMSLILCSDNQHVQLSSPREIANALTVNTLALEGAKYYEGDGVPKDYAKAAELFRQGAKEGHYLSQYSLGVIYATGEGVSRDYAEAAKWTRKSAEQGYAPAQVNLGILYLQGQGVPQDFVRAYMWFVIAEARADEAAAALPKTFSNSDRAEWAELTETAQKARAILDGVMKAADVSKANNLAIEWLANCRAPSDKQ